MMSMEWKLIKFQLTLCSPRGARPVPVSKGAAKAVGELTAIVAASIKLMPACAQQSLASGAPIIIIWAELRTQLVCRSLPSRAIIMSCAFFLSRLNFGQMDAQGMDQGHGQV